MKISINGREISQEEPPYIIAELSANHNGSIELAKKNIDAAKGCGVSAIKLQTYSADTMTINCNKKDFIVNGGPWSGSKLYDLYQIAGTPYEWHEELFAYAQNQNLTIFSTPFDESAVDLLEELDAPAYKIASFELTDLPLIKYIAQTKKPILMSTGMATFSEIEEAINTAYRHGCNQLLLFHCISSYPAPIDQANLLQINKLKEQFSVPIGLSDHTIGDVASIASVATGAVAIEKHFTLSRQNKGPDSEFSIEPSEMTNLVRRANEAWKAMGSELIVRPSSEDLNRAFRRSIYFVSDMKKGQKISSKDIRRIRPGFGLEPKYFDELIGKEVTEDVFYGDPVSWVKLDLNKEN
ncbi:pseudaminic acid synthase [Polynucleobacter sp. AP-Jannik-300A-C4]|uniref:pseudaminic acid synthase n=1 Tax=Polynucleobacter sp. AP-Jannik-300A-C4 TaxID=2576928 RepID=UPI00203FBAB2|nr:pseudaminic acid synthase [Polynucleobacter sp. AP-Jannik-300A-C4]